MAPLLPIINWADITVTGQGDSGRSSHALWRQSPDYEEEVTVILIDNEPELQALLAGPHESIPTILGQVKDHPLQLQYDGSDIPAVIVKANPTSIHVPLADLPPLTAGCITSMLAGLAGALSRLHSRGISYGYISTAGISASLEDEQAVLDDFSKARIYGADHPDAETIEKDEVSAFGGLMETLLQAVEVKEGEEEKVEGLRKLHKRCSLPRGGMGLMFDEVEEELMRLMEWRGMMRIPDVA